MKIRITNRLRKEKKLKRIAKKEAKRILTAARLAAKPKKNKAKYNNKTKAEKRKEKKIKKERQELAAAQAAQRKRGQ